MDKSSLMAAILLLGSAWSYAKPDLTLIQDFVGSYPVLEWNGGTKVSAMVEVVADDTSVGFKVTPRPVLGSLVSPSKTRLTPTDNTTLAFVDDKLVQRYESGTEFVEIQYRKKEGTLEIVSQDCKDPDHVNCDTAVFLSSAGSAMGNLIDTKTFFETYAHEYLIELAGGLDPHSSVDAAVFAEANAGVMIFPFCNPHTGTCLENLVEFPYSESSVYEKKTSTGALYTLLKKESGSGSLFQWELTGDKFNLVNFQFELEYADGKKELVTLEHKFRKP